MNTAVSGPDSSDVSESRWFVPISTGVLCSAVVAIVCGAPGPLTIALLAAAVAIPLGTAGILGMAGRTAFAAAVRARPSRRDALAAVVALVAGTLTSGFGYVVMGLPVLVCVAIPLLFVSTGVTSSRVYSSLDVIRTSLQPEVESPIVPTAKSPDVPEVLEPRAEFRAGPKRIFAPSNPHGEAEDDSRSN